MVFNFGGKVQGYADRYMGIENVDSYYTKNRSFRNYAIDAGKTAYVYKNYGFWPAWGYGGAVQNKYEVNRRNERKTPTIKAQMSKRGKYIPKRRYFKKQYGRKKKSFKKQKYSKTF